MFSTINLQEKARNLSPKRINMDVCQLLLNWQGYEELSGGVGSPPNHTVSFKQFAEQREIAILSLLIHVHLFNFDLIQLCY